jgi:hypothetical protein
MKHKSMVGVFCLFLLIGFIFTIPLGSGEIETSTSQQSSSSTNSTSSSSTNSTANNTNNSSAAIIGITVTLIGLIICYIFCLDENQRLKVKSWFGGRKNKHEIAYPSTFLRMYGNHGISCCSPISVPFLQHKIAQLANNSIFTYPKQVSEFIHKTMISEINYTPISLAHFSLFQQFSNSTRSWVYNMVRKDEIIQWEAPNRIKYFTQFRPQAVADFNSLEKQLISGKMYVKKVHSRYLAVNDIKSLIQHSSAETKSYVGLNKHQYSMVCTPSLGNINIHSLFLYWRLSVVLGVEFGSKHHFYGKMNEESAFNNRTASTFSYKINSVFHRRREYLCQNCQKLFHGSRNITKHACLKCATILCDDCIDAKSLSLKKLNYCQNCAKNPSKLENSADKNKESLQKLKDKYKIWKKSKKIFESSSLSENELKLRYAIIDHNILRNNQIALVKKQQQQIFEAQRQKLMTFKSNDFNALNQNINNLHNEILNAIQAENYSNAEKMLMAEIRQIKLLKKIVDVLEDDMITSEIKLKLKDRKEMHYKIQETQYLIQYRELSKKIEESQKYNKYEKIDESLGEAIKITEIQNKRAKSARKKKPIKKYTDLLKIMREKKEYNRYFLSFKLFESDYNKIVSSINNNQNFIKKIANLGNLIAEFEKFVQDFSKLKTENYNLSQIKQESNVLLEEMKKLQKKLKSKVKDAIGTNKTNIETFEKYISQLKSPIFLELELKEELQNCIQDLDKQFVEWGKKEKSKEGKIEEREQD